MRNIQAFYIIVKLYSLSGIQTFHRLRLSSAVNLPHPYAASPLELRLSKLILSFQLRSFQATLRWWSVSYWDHSPISRSRVIIYCCHPHREAIVRFEISSFLEGQVLFASLYRPFSITRLDIECIDLAASTGTQCQCCPLKEFDRGYWSICTGLWTSVCGVGNLDPSNTASVDWEIRRSLPIYQSSCRTWNFSTLLCLRLRRTQHSHQQEYRLHCWWHLLPISRDRSTSKVIIFKSACSHSMWQPFPFESWAPQQFIVWCTTWEPGPRHSNPMPMCPMKSSSPCMVQSSIYPICSLWVPRLNKVFVRIGSVWFETFTWYSSVDPSAW